MSRLEGLIAKYCPDGVEFRPIGDLAIYEQPGKYIVKSTDYNDEYETPVLTAGQSFILGYTNEKDGIYHATENNPVIIFDDFTGAFKWVDFPFKVKSSAMKMLTANEEITSLRYIFHLMGWLNFMSSEHKRLWIGTYSLFRVPLPPLEVQREIVRMLDNFTLLSAELSAELKARRQQYNHYLEYVLKNESTPKCRLGDLCSIKGRIGFRGYTQKDFVNEGEGAISLSPGNIESNHINYINCKYISWDKYYESPEIMVSNNDLILCKTGSTVGKVAVIDSLKEKATLNPQLVVLKEIKCNNRYLFYQLTSSAVQSKIKSLAGVGSVPNISQKAISDIEIPVPSLEEQNVIVRILDCFDKLCNDISAGIPAEIEARRKQYEYYRDKLLTFKELA